MTRSTEILQRLEAGSIDSNAITSDDLVVLDQELNELMKLIVGCLAFEEAEIFLHDLCHIQEIMATLAFKYSIQLSNRQREIVREYDRCDIAEVRLEVFRKIKNEVFPWRSGQ